MLAKRGDKGKTKTQLQHLEIGNEGLFLWLRGVPAVRRLPRKKRIEF